MLLLGSSRSTWTFPVDDEPVLEGSALDAAVNNNADAQAEKFDPDTKVVAQIIDQEPAAELANGDADLSTTGQANQTLGLECKTPHVQFCCQRKCTVDTAQSVFTQLSKAVSAAVKCTLLHVLLINPVLYMLYSVQAFEANLIEYRCLRR